MTWKTRVMAMELCAACAELLPDINSRGPGECPHCGLEYPGTASTHQLINRRTGPLPSPRELIRRRRELADRTLREVMKAEFTPLGLDDSWRGSRWISGHGSSQAHGRSRRSRRMEVTSIDLTHGERLVAGERYVDVSTRVSWRHGLVTAAQDLLWHVWHDQRDGLDALQTAHRSQTPFNGWDSHVLTANSVDTTAWTLRVGELDVMLAEIEGFTVSCVSRNMSTSEIVLEDVDVRRYVDLPSLPET